MYLSNKAKCSEYGGRATARRRTQLLCIEGEYVTLEQIAARLGLERCATSDRLRYQQKKPGPVTWKGLAGSVGHAVRNP